MYDPNTPYEIIPALEQHAWTRHVTGSGGWVHSSSQSWAWQYVLQETTLKSVYDLLQAFHLLRVLE